MWEFDSITDFCKLLLGSTIDTVLVVVIAKRFKFHELLRNAYMTLSRRSEPISAAEACRMGPQAAAEIAQVRETRQTFLMASRVHQPKNALCPLCHGVTMCLTLTTPQRAFGCHCLPCSLTYYKSEIQLNEFLTSRMEKKLDKFIPSENP